MSRRLAVAALGAAFLTLCLAPTAWAQRGGRGGGFGGGHVGGFGGGQVGVVSHGGGFAYHGPGSVTRSGVIITNGWYGYPYHGGYGNGYPHYGYRRYWRYGYGSGGWWGYPWWGWGWDNDNSYQSQPVQYYPSTDDSYYQQQALQQQDEIDRLHDEVDRLRDQRQPQTTQSSASSAVSQPTELVYRDKHTEKIENYAIVGQTLWILNEQRSRKIPLAELDVPATQQANEAHGVEFNLPR